MLTTIMSAEPTPKRRPFDPALRKPPAPPPVWKIEQINRLTPAGNPPCFADRQEWMDYLVQAVGDSRSLLRDGPLHLTPAGVALNPGWSYCDDCMAQRERAMQILNRCDKTFWQDPTKEPKA